MTTIRKTKLANSVLNKHARAKALYEKADTQFNQLLAKCRVGEVIDTNDGQMVLVDNYATSNTAFRVARVNRFELKKVKKAAKQDPAATADEETQSIHHGCL